jgi:hypothetical protein
VCNGLNKQGIKSKKDVIDLINKGKKWKDVIDAILDKFLLYKRENI